MRGHGSLQSMLGRSGWLNPKRKRDAEQDFWLLADAEASAAAAMPLPGAMGAAVSRGFGFGGGGSARIVRPADSVSPASGQLGGPPGAALPPRGRGGRAAAARVLPPARPRSGSGPDSSGRGRRGKPATAAQQPAWDWTANKPASRPGTSAKEAAALLPPKRQAADRHADDLPATPGAPAAGSGVGSVPMSVRGSDLGTSSLMPCGEVGQQTAAGAAYACMTADADGGSATDDAAVADANVAAACAASGAHGWVTVVCPLAGLRHRGGAAQAALLALLASGKRHLNVRLCREAGNPIDGNAIQVMLALSCS
jgi:hypothetical protein